MSDIVPTTRLEAVNELLSIIGEAPVTSLSGDLTVDVVTADATLSQVLKDVLAQGWYFNTEHDYPLSRNDDDEILIPADIIHADVNPLSGSQLKVVIRGGKLYDLTEHTTEFEDDVELTVVRLLDFEDLPISAKSYITHRASRLFQAKMLGSRDIAQEASINETQALAALKADDDAWADHNIFSSPAVSRVLFR